MASIDQKIIKLMKEPKRPSDQYEMPVIKKSQSIHKSDLFEEFEDNRQIFKKDKEPMSSLMGKLKTKQKKTEAQDEDYNDDFEDVDNGQKIETKYKSQLPSIGVDKKASKLPDSRKKYTLDEKYVARSRVTRSVMNSSPNNVNSLVGQPNRYQVEVQKKFGNLSAETMTNDAINRTNEQIREFIKRYNQVLTQLINRNLAELTNKNKKKIVPIEETIKVLQEQIKNNAKIEQFDVTELKKLNNYKEKLEEQENYSEKTIEEEKQELITKIKELRKDIITKKLAVENEGKKLIPNNIVITKSQHQSEFTILKEKILNARKQWEKNQEKIDALKAREADLAAKVQQIVNADREADEMRTHSKKNQDKSKKYQQVKKKHESIKSHSTKMESLWATKSNMISHEIQSLRTKVKNLELQIKNIEQSSKQSFEKSSKYLTTLKPKNQAQHQAIEKIIGEMNGYSTDMHKQMSLSQIKLMASSKKLSVDFRSSKDGKELNEDLTKHVSGNKDDETGSKSSQKNRVWKPQLKDEHEKKEKPLLKISKTEKNNIKLTFDGTMLEEKVEQAKEKTKAENSHSEVQAKPKKFNFNRKQREEESVLPPSEQEQEQEVKVKVEQHKEPESIESRDVSKPIFNLRKKLEERENEKQSRT